MTRTCKRMVGRLTLLCLCAAVWTPALAMAKPKRGTMPPVMVVERAWPPVVHVRMLVGTGALADPQGQEGLAQLTWQTALRGAGPRDRGQMAAALDALGARLDVDVDKLGVTLTGDVLLEHLDPFLALMADTLLQPKLEASEVEHMRTQLLADLAHVRDDDAALAADALGRYLYRGQALGRPSGGTESSLRSIGVEAIRQFRRRSVVAGNMRVGFAGPVDEATAQKLVSKYLELPAGTPPKSGEGRAVSDGRRLLLVDKPRHNQAEVVLAWTAVAANHRDMTAIGIANAILGGTFSSRLNREIRELRGWSYNTWSALSAGPTVSTWALGFTPATGDAVPAVDLAVRILEEMAQQGLTPKELRFAKDHLKGSHLASLESAERELAMRMRAQELGLPADLVDTYAARVEAVDYKTIQRVLREHCKPEQIVAVIVGQAKILDGKLADSASQFAVERLPTDGQPESTTVRGKTARSRPAPVDDAPPPPVSDDPSASDGEGPDEGDEPEEGAEEGPTEGEEAP